LYLHGNGPNSVLIFQLSVGRETRHVFMWRCLSVPAAPDP